MSPISRDTLKRTTLGLALPAVLALGLTPAAADAAGPRPDFQMPFACGQTWDASTYTNADETKDHWPDEDSIDLAQRGDDLENLSLGEPVLASAAGTISRKVTKSNGETQLFIDHGDGWETYYVHTKMGPLAVGDEVAQGQQIAQVDKKGSPTLHLHYTQLKDGEAVRVVFDGKEIDTHQGDPDSYGHWGTADAERLTSANCPGNSFAAFEQDGDDQVFAYRPGNGYAWTVELGANGAGSNVWNGHPGFQWTSFVPFTAGGEPHALRYSSATGNVQIDRIADSGLTKIATSQWGTGWSNFTPFRLGGSAYYLVYDQMTGAANVDRISSDAKKLTTVSQNAWTRGWTSVEAFSIGGKQYVALYKRLTGQLKIQKLALSGDEVTFTTVSSTTIPAGASHVVPLVQNGVATLLSYDPTTGAARFQKLSPDAIPYPSAVGTASWTSDWTTFTPFVRDGRAHVLLHKSRTGEVGVVKLDAGYTSATKIHSSSWDPGLA